MTIEQSLNEAASASLPEDTNNTSVETLPEDNPPLVSRSTTRVRVNTATSTSSILKESLNDEIERIVGFLAGSYGCVYNGVHGTLYAGSQALLFLGYMFFFEKKITIAWEKIRQVQKLDQGVAVIAKDETIHSFTVIHAPARMWVILVSLHNDALLDVPGSSARASRKRGRFPIMSPDARHQSNRTMKRRNSDPASASQSFFELDSSTTTTTTASSRNPSEEEPEADEDAAIAPAMIASRQKEVFRKSESIKTNTQSTSKLKKTQDGEPKRPVLDWFKDLAEPKIQVIEEKVGILKLQGTPCSHAGYSGKLYAGNSGIMFAGKRMPWENEKVFISFRLIRQFQIQGKEERSSQKQSTRKRGIAIITKDGQVYGFGSMENADKVWASLIALQNENLATQGETLSRRTFLTRMNSDPLMPSRMSFDESSHEAADGDDLDQHSIASSSTATPNLAEEWAAEVAKQRDFSNTVVKGQILPCTLDKFLELFVADNAPYSIAKFLESRGDSSLEVSEWERSKESEQNRIIHYKHPVNAPLAPPIAGARKEQSFRRYGDHGLCVETKTFVDDVPMADCFYVADRVRVAPKGSTDIAVTMEFDVKFTKSTMFKGIIGKTTTSEFTDLFQSLFEYFKRNVGESAPNADMAAIAKQPMIARQPPVSPYQSTLVPVVLCCVVVFQLYIMWEVHKISLVVQSMQNQCQAVPDPVLSVE